MTAPAREIQGLPDRPEDHSAGLGIAAALVFAVILSLGLMAQEPVAATDTAANQPASDLLISVVAAD